MKIKKSLLIGVIVFAFSVCLGLLASNGKAPTFKLVSLGLWVITFLTITCFVGVIDVFLKKRLFLYPGIVSIGLILALLTCFVSINVRKGLEQKKAEEIISQIEKYKEINGVYPLTLDLVNLEVEERTKYSPSENLKSFNLSYSFDGWHRNSYNSIDKKWIEHD